MKPLQILELAYFYYRESILTIDALNEILSAHVAIPAWFNETSLNKIIRITSREKGLTSVGYTDASFSAAYYSACIVRHADEIEKNAMIANSIQLLAIVDKRLIETSDAISLRLSNSDIIKYDAPLDGGPLLSKSERTLLSLVDNTA
jgi:hypothetical protein